jgi:hypothetical protein
MSYNPNIPANADLVSSDISQMQLNFSQANTIIGKDHYEFDNASTANRGFHKQVTFPVRAAGNPILASPTGELYTKLVSTATELFFSNGTAVTQLSGLPELVASNGNITFQNGLQFKWGRMDTSGSMPAGIVNDKYFFYPSGDNPFDPTQGFPTNTLVVFVQGITNSATNKTINIRPPGTVIGDFNQFGFTCKAADNWTDGFFYFAIGN